MKHLLICIAAVAIVGTSNAQERPRPYPVIPGPKLEAALANGTRSADGSPGPNYWTNYAEYSISALLSPATKQIQARSTVRYQNNSPDTLDQIMVHVRQNLHAAGGVRNRPQQVTGGVSLSRVAVAGDDIIEVESRAYRDGAVGYSMNGTVMRIRLVEALMPGASLDLAFAWAYTVPDVGAPRNGTDGDVFFMAYWYPQIAVYDDVNGWKADAYMGAGEIYAGYAHYDVHLTVPEGWLIGATGELANPEEVLSEQTLARIDASRANPEYIVRVVDENERVAGVNTRESASGALQWHFQAGNVRDFAWGTSASYMWDMTAANVSDGESSDIHAFWRPESTAWMRSAEFGRYSIEYLSDTFFPYPYPHMTAMEGIIGGGMEFPMITLIGSRTEDRRLFSTTFHEIGHMYFPMLVGQDEKENTWMDEGLTSFNTTEASIPFWNEDGWDPAEQSYYEIAGTGDERPSRRHGDQYPLDTRARGTAAYNKPAVSLNALRGLLGNDLFYEAFSEYSRRWAYKHPQPEDLFNTFEDVVGQDLDWFWTTMFYTTWTLDQSIASVSSDEQGVTVVIADRGLSPFPVPLRVTYESGEVVDVRLPVEPWLDGEKSQTATFRAGAIERVEIDPERFLPDVDRSNNSWSR